MTTYYLTIKIIWHTNRRQKFDEQKSRQASVKEEQKAVEKFQAEVTALTKQDDKTKEAVKKYTYYFCF